MQLYAIMRRAGWHSRAELEQAAARSTHVTQEELPDEVRWIRTYVLDEGGALGTVCLYEASGPEALRRHAALAGLPADEIVPVADTLFPV